MGLCYDEPYDLEVEPSNFRLLTKEERPQESYKKSFSDMCQELETTFKQYEDEDDPLKIRLVYFTGGVLIGAKSNVCVNLEYLDLIEDMDRTTPVLLLLRERDEEGAQIQIGLQRNEILMTGDKWQVVGIREIVPTEVDKNSGYWT
ncbi:unnamed protein product [Malus baccata var. baccata]